MFPAIEKHINQSISNLSGCLEISAVPAIVPHAALPSEFAVDGPCPTDRQALHSAREVIMTVRLYYQVQVLALN